MVPAPWTDEGPSWYGRPFILSLIHFLRRSAPFTGPDSGADLNLPNPLLFGGHWASSYRLIAPETLHMRRRVTSS